VSGASTSLTLVAEQLLPEKRQPILMPFRHYPSDEMTVREFSNRMLPKLGCKPAATSPARYVCSPSKNPPRVASISVRSLTTTSFRSSTLGNSLCTGAGSSRVTRYVETPIG